MTLQIVDVGLRGLSLLGEAVRDGDAAGQVRLTGSAVLWC